MSEIAIELEEEALARPSRVAQDLEGVVRVSPAAQHSTKQAVQDSEGVVRLQTAGGRTEAATRVLLANPRCDPKGTDWTEMLD